MSVCMEPHLYMKEITNSPSPYPKMTLESNEGHSQDGVGSRFNCEMGNLFSSSRKKEENDYSAKNSEDKYGDVTEFRHHGHTNDMKYIQINQENSADNLQNVHRNHFDESETYHLQSNHSDENSSESWSIISVNSEGDKENLYGSTSGSEIENSDELKDIEPEVKSDYLHSNNNNSILKNYSQNEGKLTVSKSPENLEVILEESELTSTIEVSGSNESECNVCSSDFTQGRMSTECNSTYDVSDAERLQEDEEFIIQLSSYKSYNDLSKLGIEDPPSNKEKPDVFINNNQSCDANQISCNSCSQDGMNNKTKIRTTNDSKQMNPLESSSTESDSIQTCSKSEDKDRCVQEQGSVEFDIRSHRRGCPCSECSAFTSLSSSQLDIHQYAEFCEQDDDEDDDDDNDDGEGSDNNQLDDRSGAEQSDVFDEETNCEQISDLHISANVQNKISMDIGVQSCSSFSTSEHGSVGSSSPKFSRGGKSSPQFSTRESGFYDEEVENYEVLDDEIQEDEEYENLEVPCSLNSRDNVTRTCSDVIHTSSNVRWDGDVMCTCDECLRGLRIERILTEDKATMCPEEPPYVLMCEICEELLENQLQKTEKDTKKKEETLKREIKELKRENDAHQKVIQENLQLGPEAKIEATMQHEITRLTSENLDLRESKDKKDDQIRKLKKMLKVYAKRLKEGEAAEIAAELEKEDKQASVDNMASVKHRERSYMGMLEYRKEDETVLVKNLIMDLKPKVASGLLPGLPAYVLFMCVRHTDYINDDEKVRSLLTNTINGIKKCVKKHHSELDRVTLWLANTCRLLHTLKQYSGEKAFQSENTSRQNEHCLRNFDLSEYRQVFSDLAVWIYQTMIKQMEETLQPMVVPAVLEHEAIAGLSASKPSGMRGRSSSSLSDEIKELSLDSLMKALNKYSQALSQHAVDPELIKQIFRQIYHFICASALNNLLLRKDMCNWSKGMQIRYNLSHLEQWLRDNKLQESGALGTLEPVIQASQLLQARKSVADVDSICEMCSKLTTPQIVKILNLYTPVDEFEEKVPVSFIRKIQEKLKGRQGESDNTLLMDTKFSFPVTFPFNPSSVTLDSVDVPQGLHVGFLVRV